MLPPDPSRSQDKVLAPSKAAEPARLTAAAEAQLLHRNAARWTTGDGFETIDSGSSVWRKPLTARGLEIDKQLGGNLPEGFPTFDKFTNGVATSIKSMDLKAQTYKEATNVTNKLKEYIDAVTNFEYDARRDVAIDGSELSGRALQLAVPAGRISKEVAEAIAKAIEYAKSPDVTVTVVKVK